LSAIRVRVGFRYDRVGWSLRSGGITALCGCGRRCWAREVGRDRSERHREEAGVCLEEEGRKGSAKERSCNELILLASIPDHPLEIKDNSPSTP